MQDKKMHLLSEIEAVLTHTLAKSLGLDPTSNKTDYFFFPSDFLFHFQITNVYTFLVMNLVLQNGYLKFKIF